MYNKIDLLDCHSWF